MSNETRKLIFFLCKNQQFRDKFNQIRRIFTKIGVLHQKTQNFQQNRFKNEKKKRRKRDYLETEARENAAPEARRQKYDGETEKRRKGQI